MVKAPPTRKETDERARRAVAEFRKVQHTLTSFARVLTGKSDVSVEMHATSNGHTDGKKIYYRPNLSLGDDRRHDTGLCDRRDADTGQQRCPACKAREQMMATIYHEVSHIAFDTFIEPGADHVKEAMKFARDTSTEKFWKRTMARMMRSGPPKTYPELAGAINPYLHPLVNALEDVRINERMHEARPGTRAMMEGLITEVALDGVPSKDGKNKHWREMHPNHQAGVAAYCYAAGFDITDWFGEEVSLAFADEKLKSLLDNIKYCQDAHETFQQSFEVFMRLRELGFFQLKEEKEADEEEQKEDVPTPPLPQPKDEDDEDGDEPEDGSGSDSHDEGGQADDQSGGGKDSSESDDPSAGDDDGEAESGQPEEGGSDEDLPAEDDLEQESAGDGSGDDGGADEVSGDDEDGPADSSSQPGEADSDANELGGSGGRGEAPPDGDGESGDEDEGESEASTEDSNGSDLDSGDAGGGDGGDGGDGSDDSEIAPDDVEPIAYNPEKAIDNTDAETPDYSIDPDEEAERTIPTLVEFGLHTPEAPMSSAEESAVETAIIQGIYFEQPSSNIKGVNEWSYENATEDSRRRSWHGWNLTLPPSHRKAYGMIVDPVPESVLAPALMRMRIVFAENKRTKRNRNQRAGRIDARVLGKRAWGEDDRLFGRKIVPGKRDYFVLIGLDISGSTAGDNLKLIKEAAMAQADLCHRTGIKFAVFAHTGSPTEGSPYGNNLSVDIYHVKGPDEMWDEKARKRLADLGPSYANLDGHTLEFYRKLCDKRTESDKVILYYSDGAMPAENYQEELQILQREIRTCVQKGYTLLGVGIRTSDPEKHGLPSVRVDSNLDTIKVVTQLERTLTA